MKKIIIVIISLFFLTGCYNYIELSNLGIASSIKIDFKDEYYVDIEVYDDDLVKIINGHGETINEALIDAYSSFDKKIYYQHLNAVFITKNVNINEVIYYFLRNPNTGNNFFLLYTDETIYEDNTINQGEKIKNIMTEKEIFSFFNISKNYINNYTDIVLPIYSDNKINSLKVVKNNEYLFNIEKQEYQVYMMLLNMNESNFVIKCDNNTAEINIENAYINYKIDNNITINVNLRASIKEYTCRYNLNNIEEEKKFKNLVISTLNNNVYYFMNKLKEEEVDLLGLNKKTKNKFYEYKYYLNTDVNIYKKGLLLK